MKADLIIGIDPGIKGGIAVLDKNGTVVEVNKMPETVADLAELFISTLSRAGVLSECHAYLEKVHSGVFGGGGSRMGVKSAFTFGKGLGRLEGVLAALRIPLDEVAPVRWQKELSCLTGGDKNISKNRAQQLFPRVRVTHAIADALLIAEYGRRVNG